jgi:hypothetical protein
MAIKLLDPAAEPLLPQSAFLRYLYASPISVSATVCVPAPALSLMTIEPVRVPVALGLK